MRLFVWKAKWKIIFDRQNKKENKFSGKKEREKKKMEIIKDNFAFSF